MTEAIVQCPRCAVTHRVERYASVNVTLEPALKDGLLSRDLTRCTCPGCGHAIHVVDGLLYHDMDARLMVYVHEPREGRGAPNLGRPPLGYRARIVPGLDALVEKVLIEDANLDDRAVEILKHRVCRRLVEGYREGLSRLEALPLNLALMTFAGVVPDGVGEIAFVLRVRGGEPEHALKILIETSALEEPWDPKAELPEPNAWLEISPAWAMQRAVGGAEPLDIKVCLGIPSVRAVAASVGEWRDSVTER